MASDYRDYLMKNLPVMQQQPPKPNAAQAQQIVADAFNRMLASRVIQPGTGPVQQPVQGRVAGMPILAGNPVSAMPMPNPRSRSMAPPGIDYSGGGSGVTANDINGQLGPVVVDPKYRKPESVPQVPQAQDIKFFEENTQLPTGTMPLTPEQEAVKVEQEKVASEEQLVAYANTLIDTPGTSEQQAYAMYIDGGWSDQEARDIVIKNFRNGLKGNGKFFGGIIEANDIVDKPRQLVVQEMGANAYDVATGKADEWSAEWAGIAPGNWNLVEKDTFDPVAAATGAEPREIDAMTNEFKLWAEDPNNWQAIRNASENGFQATGTDPMFTGGRAVWELFINTKGFRYRLFADILNDPTILTGVGKNVGDNLIESAIRMAPDGSVDRAVGKTVLGRTLSLPQNIMDATVDAPFNFVGNKIGGAIRDSRAGKLLQETPEAKATEDVNRGWQATGQQDRIRTEMGDQTPPGDGLEPEPPVRPDLPPEGPRYTRERDGNLWRIKDPNGKTVQTMKWEQQVGPEDSFPNREAERVVNDYNATIIRKEYEGMGAVLPNEGELTWTDPAYMRRTNRGNDAPAPIQERVAFDNTLDPDARRTWMEKWTPAAKDHESVMAEFDVENEKALRSAGLSPEQVIVQRQQPMNSPAATFEQVRFYVEDGLLPFNELFPGQTQRAREWITTPNPKRDVNGIITADNNLNTLIEHAVLGTRDDAIRARAILHQRGIRVDGFKDTGAFVDRLAKMGEAINGPGWRSQKGEAARKRTMRAGQQPITEAGVADATNTHVWTPKEIGRENPELSYIEAVAESKRRNTASDVANGSTMEAGQSATTEAVSAELPEPEGISADNVRVIPIDQPDEVIADAISDPATVSVTPAKNRVEPTPEGQVRVRPAGTIKQKAVTIKRAKRGYTVAVGETGRPSPVTTLQQALDVADEVIAREAKGIDPTPVEIKRAVADVADRPLWFDPNALEADGWTRMATDDGSVAYTRNGNVLRDYPELDPETAMPVSPSGTAGITYTNTSLDSIVTDTGSFQNRKAEFSEQSVQNILSNYDPRKFEPIEVKANGDGTYTVLSGHSRHEAWKRLSAAGTVDQNAVPIRIQNGTPEELKLLAQTSNTRGTANTPTEKGRLLTTLVDSGMSWNDAIREVNVNSADGKRLRFLTNLTEGMQDDVDAGRLSVRQGALLGESIEKGVITPVEADQLFLDKIAKEGMSDAQLKTFLDAAAILKERNSVQQGDMFGSFSIMSATVKDMSELVRVQKELVTQQSLLTRAGKSTAIDEATRGGLNAAVGKLQKELTDVLARINGSLYAINPRVSRNIDVGERARRSILSDAGAIDGPASGDNSWWLSKGDNSYVGAAHTIGKIDDATYQTLNKMVMWERTPMRMWEAYDHALINFDDPLTAKKVIANLAIDPETALELAAKKEARDNARGLKGIAYKALTAYETALRFLREAIMFNWARGFSSAFADSTGNAYTLTIHGEGRALGIALDPRSAKTFIQSERGKQLAIDNLPYMDRFKALTGGEPDPSWVQLVETRFETGGGPLVLESLGKSYHAFRMFADKDIKAFRTGMDRNFRYAVGMANFNNNIKKSQTRFRGIVAERAQRTGNDYVDWLAKLDALGNDYTPDDILRTFNDERLARDLRALITDSKVQARKRVNELLFSYKYTNLDDKLRNVVFFHYWMSRALPMHAKVTFKNPWLLNAYSRAWDHMEREAEQNGYPPNVRGFIQMQKSQSGFYSLLNPIQVLVPFGMLVDSNDDPGVMAFLKRWGFFINPLIEGAAASLGWTRTVPDLTGTAAVRRALRYTINYMNSNGLEQFVPDALGDPNTWNPSIVDEAQFRIIEKINGYAQRFEAALTGTTQIIDEYEGASKNAYEYDQLNSILITELEKEYGPYDTWEPDSPAFDDYLDAKTAIEMGAGGNDLADHAVEVMADAKFDATWQGAFIPGGIYQRYGPRDETLAESRDGDQAAKDQRELATDTTGSAKLDIAQNQYMAIGTERQKAFSETYNQIVSDTPMDGYDNGQMIQIGGEAYTKTQLLDLTEDERFNLADAWVNQHGGTEELAAYRDERDAFVQKHPEFGEFKDYQSIAYDYDGGLAQFRIDRANGNPNFKKAMDEHRKYLLDVVGVDPKVIEQELDAWAPTIAAYKAANGIQDSMYDSPPISTGDQPTINTLVNMGMLNGSKNESGGSYTGKKSTADTLKKSIKEYDADLKLVEGLLQQYGVDPSVLTSSNPYAASSVNALVGDLMPTESKLLRQYRGWVQLQPPGVDTSPEAFAAVIDAIAQDEAA